MIHRWWRAFGFLALLSVGLGLVLATLLASAPADALGHVVVHVDGERISLAELHARPVVGLVLGSLVGFVVLLLVPIVVCVPLLMAALGLAVALLVVGGLATIALSPFLLVAWIAWRIGRRPPQPAP